MQLVELNVSGMTCGHCVMHVEKAIHQLNADAAVKVDLSSGKVTISTNSPIQLEPILAKLEEEGYPASLNIPVLQKQAGSCGSGGGCCCR